MDTTHNIRFADDFYPIVAIGAFVILLLSACAPAGMTRATTPLAATPAPQALLWKAPAEAAPDMLMAAADTDLVGASIANFDR